MKKQILKTCFVFIFGLFLCFLGGCAITNTKEEDVIEAIQKLPEDITLSDESRVIAAREMIEKLGDDSNISNISVLEKAEAKIIYLKEAKVVSEMIEKIGDVTLDSKTTLEEIFSKYEKLSGEAKEYVKNYFVYEYAKSKYDKLVQEKVELDKNQEQSKALVSKINNLPNNLTEEDSDLINALLEEYFGLTDKSLVTNSGKLFEAAKEVNQLVVESNEIENYQKAAKVVVDAINEIEDVTLQDKEKIDKVVALYQELKSYELPYVTNYDKLREAIIQISLLQRIEDEKELIIKQLESKKSSYKQADYGTTEWTLLHSKIDEKIKEIKESQEVPTFDLKKFFIDLEQTAPSNAQKVVILLNKAKNTAKNEIINLYNDLTSNEYYEPQYKELSAIYEYAINVIDKVTSIEQINTSTLIEALKSVKNAKQMKEYLLNEAINEANQIIKEAYAKYDYKEYRQQEWATLTSIKDNAIYSNSNASGYDQISYQKCIEDMDLVETEVEYLERITPQIDCDDAIVDVDTTFNLGCGAGVSSSTNRLSFNCHGTFEYFEANETLGYKEGNVICIKFDGSSIPTLKGFKLYIDGELQSLKLTDEKKDLKLYFNIGDVTDVYTIVVKWNYEFNPITYVFSFSDEAKFEVSDEKLTKLINDVNNLPTYMGDVEATKFLNIKKIVDLMPTEQVTSLTAACDYTTKESNLSNYLDMKTKLAALNIPSRINCEEDITKLSSYTTTYTLEPGEDDTIFDFSTNTFKKVVLKYTPLNVIVTVTDGKCETQRKETINFGVVNKGEVGLFPYNSSTSMDYQDNPSGVVKRPFSNWTLKLGNKVYFIVSGGIKFVDEKNDLKEAGTLTSYGTVHVNITDQTFTVKVSETNISQTTVYAYGYVHIRDGKIITASIDHTANTVIEFRPGDILYAPRYLDTNGVSRPSNIFLVGSDAYLQYTDENINLDSDCYTLMNNLYDLDTESIDFATSVASYRYIYNSCTNIQKALMAKENYQIYLFEQIVIDNANRKAAKDFDDLVTALPAIDTLSLTDESSLVAARNLYTTLTDEQKAYTTKVTVLVSYEAKITELKDKKAASDVDELIEALPDTITLSETDAVLEAEERYNALTIAQKSYVTKFDKLTAAKNAWLALCSPAQQSQAKDQAKIVTDAIALIPTELTLGDMSKVSTARTLLNDVKDITDEAVRSLTIIYISSSELTKLENAEARIVELVIDTLPKQIKTDYSFNTYSNTVTYKYTDDTTVNTYFNLATGVLLKSVYAVNNQTVKVTFGSKSSNVEINFGILSTTNTGVYYTGKGVNQPGSVETQTSATGFEEYTITIGTMTYFLPIKSYIPLTSVGSTDEEARKALRPYSYKEDGTINSTYTFSPDNNQGLIKGIPTKENGAGTLYENTSDVDLTFKHKLTYGRVGTWGGYYKIIFSPTSTTGSYSTAIMVGQGDNDATITLKPGEFLWCPHIFETNSAYGTQLIWNSSSSTGGVLTSSTIAIITKETIR